MNTYAHRRQSLLQALPDHSVVIVPAAHEALRNGDSHYLFRQDSDFYYLSGFSEPDAYLLLRKQNNKTDYHLFVLPHSPEQEIWTGRRVGVEHAVTDFYADKAYSVAEFKQQLPELLRGYHTIFYPLGRYCAFDVLLMTELATLRKSKLAQEMPVAIEDLVPFLSELRLHKEPEEMQHLQRAADISVQAHLRGLTLSVPGMKEYELAAEYLYVFTKEGASGPAYPPIVAAGANACTLHYTENSAILTNGELVLVDAGAEYAGYASDITRTFPINGRFSAEQRAIYDIVLSAQLAVIDALKPGVSSHAPQQIAIRVITEGLLSLGLLQGDVDTLIEQKAYTFFYMHGCSHWLGLDTHDAGSYKIQNQWRALRENMVLTVEPGIYIRPRADIDPRWHNIGVRIEDDVVITKAGCRVLTQALPKTIIDIEHLMQ